MKYKTFGRVTALLALLVISLSGCKQFSANKDDVKLKEVEALFGTLPVHPGFQQSWSGSVSTSTLASLGRHYKSVAPYDDVKNFYLSNLQSAGWKLKEERELRSSAGSRQLTFSKEQYFFVIEYSGDKAVDPDWNYGIDVSWKSRKAF